LTEKRLETALKVAHQAGEFLLSKKEAILTIDQKSSWADLVTNVDLEAQELIISLLKTSFPDDFFFGEEGSISLEHLNKTWVIDPIDGTSNFIYRLPFFSVSIAFFELGVPTIGIVHIPELRETFWAARGKGAYLNGKRICISGKKTLDSALIATGFPYDIALREKSASLYTELLPAVNDLRAYGAASIELCYVACGRFDAYFEPQVALYDIAASLVVLSEAGGEFKSLDGKEWEPTSTSLIAANHHLLLELLEFLAMRKNRPNGNL